MAKYLTWHFQRTLDIFNAPLHSSGFSVPRQEFFHGELVGCGAAGLGPATAVEQAANVRTGIDVAPKDRAHVQVSAFDRTAETHLRRVGRRLNTLIKRSVNRSTNQATISIARKSFADKGRDHLKLPTGRFLEACVPFNVVAHEHFLTRREQVSVGDGKDAQEQSDDAHHGRQSA